MTRCVGGGFCEAKSTFFYAIILNMNIKIRKATIKDLDGVLILVKKLIDFHHDLDTCYRPASKRRLMKSFLEKTFREKNTEIFVAEENKIIVGYLMINVSKTQQRYSFSKMGSVWDIFIEEEYRRKGLTKKLLREALEWFRLKGVRNIELSVNFKNKIGIKTWQKLGFSNQEITMFMKLKL